MRARRRALPLSVSYTTPRDTTTLDEHIALIAVLEEGDPARAQTQIQEHIQRAFMARMKAFYDFSSSRSA